MEKTLLKGLAMLEAVALSDEPCGVSELARRQGVTKSNAHRLLQTLAAARYVIHNRAGGTYTASPRLFEFGMLVGSRIDVRKAALPVMHRLAQETGENVGIAVLDAGEAMYLEHIVGPSPVRLMRSGGRVPAYCSSSGKVLLAHEDEAEIDRLEGIMVPFTSRTVSGVTALKEELARIRKRGFAVIRGEWHPHVAGIAVPVPGRNGTVAAALAISGPIERFTQGAVKAHVAAARAAAEEISAQLA